MALGYIDFAETLDGANFHAILAHYGIKAQAVSGDEVKIHCPFHEDSTPSCFVNTTKRLYNCFACGAGGNAIAFVQNMEHLGNDTDGLRAAANTLAGLNGQGGSITTAPRGAASNQASCPTQKVELLKKKELATNKPLTFRLTTVREHPFFQSHGISAQMIYTFDLGYCDTGIMAGRIVIPIHSGEGQLVAYAGRHGAEDIPNGVPRYKLPKVFHKSVELYNLHRAREISTSHIVLVEGFWSAMRLHLAGISTVAVMGTALSDPQVDLLRKAGYRSATVLFDGDEAGRKGADAAIASLGAVMDVQRLDLPDGIKPDAMDADWMARLNAL